MPSIHAVVPRQLSNTWSLVTAGSGSSVGGPFGGADDVPRGASPSSGRVFDDAVAGGGVDGVASEDGMATSDPLFSALGRRLRFPATTRPGGARVGADPAPRDAPRKDASGVAADRWRMRVRVIMPACAKPPSEVRRVPYPRGNVKFESVPPAPERGRESTPQPSPGGGPGRRVADGGARGRRRGRASPVHGTGPGPVSSLARGVQGPEGRGGPSAIPRGALEGGTVLRRLGRFVRSRPRGARGSRAEETRP